MADDIGSDVSAQLPTVSGPTPVGDSDATVTMAAADEEPQGGPETALTCDPESPVWGSPDVPDLGPPAQGADPIIADSEPRSNRPDIAQRARRSAALRKRLVRWRSTALGLGLAAMTVVVLERDGVSADFGNTLQIMGFDPDRAGLLASLLLGGVAAAVVAIVGGRLAVAIGAGTVVVLATFYPVFRHETGAALHASGPEGTFDPVGWGLSALTLLTVSLIVGWAAAVLARDVNARLTKLGSEIREALVERQRAPRASLRVAGALVVVAALGIGAPIFGDMVNFDPDAHMRQGAPQAVALFGGGQSNANAGADAAAAGSSLFPPGASTLAQTGDLVPGPFAGSYVSEGALSTARPWAAHRPVGGGRIVSTTLPAPWIDGLSNVATVDVYLPPGYDQTSVRYPVVYEPHQPLWAWEQSIHVTALLDNLIRTGVFPPEIVVFVGQSGGPFPDSECADSYDGREWFDRYLATDVPQYLDATYRTIPTTSARSLLGFSAGGYCAAAALTHHPDVFGTALVFSGYFEAGITTSTTPTAGRPFNDDPSREAKVSPISVVPRLSAAQRSEMFFTFSADPTNRFYANEVSSFSGVLTANRVPFAVLPTPFGHSWAAVREQFPAMLGLLAARQVHLGVFQEPVGRVSEP
jgi:enterochelin esterase-like enzyme